MSRHARALDQLVRELRAQRPGVTIGTDRPGIDPDSDHTPWLKDADGIGVCRAADIMGSGPSWDKLAASLAAKLGKHPAMGTGAYVIWKQRIISADRLVEGWRGMEDRGSVTANHFDHVHVSLTTRQGGYDYAGKWGALFTGTATGAAPTPTEPPASAAPGGGYSVAGAGQGVGIGLPGLPGVDDIGEALYKGVVVAGALALGAVLIALGAARATKPARQATQAATQKAGEVALTVAAPQASAATAATKTTGKTKTRGA